MVEQTLERTCCYYGPEKNKENYLEKYKSTEHLVTFFGVGELRSKSHFPYAARSEKNLCTSCGPSINRLIAAKDMSGFAFKIIVYNLRV